MIRDIFRRLFAFRLISVEHLDALRRRVKQENGRAARLAARLNTLKQELRVSRGTIAQRTAELRAAKNRAARYRRQFRELNGAVARLHPTPDQREGLLERADVFDLHGDRSVGTEAQPASGVAAGQTSHGPEASGAPAKRDRHEFVYLRDQRALSDEELTKARRVCAYARRVADARSEYLSEHGLDLDVYFPMANWSLDSPIYEGYRLVAAGDREVLDNLRLFSQVFTGYRLIDLRDARGLPIPSGVPPDLDARLRELAHAPDAWVERYEHVIDGLPAFMKCGPPARFGEIGWLVDRAIVTRDTYVYLERLALLHEAGLIKSGNRRNLISKNRVMIVEIGGGYGGLAYYLRRAVPQARYVIIDLPESLIFSGIYLSILFPDLENQLVAPHAPDLHVPSTPGFTFVPNYMFPSFRSKLRADLVINTLSMSEMTERQVRDYCEGIREMIGGHGVFFEQNQDNRSLGFLNAREIIAEYFSACVTLEGKLVEGHTQGAPHLWAMPERMADVANA